MSAPITDAHRKLRETLEIRWMHATEWEIEQIIADSEAKAVAQWSGGLDQSLPDLYEAAKAERDQLRAEVEDLKARITQDHGIVELMEAELKDLKSAGGPPFIRSEAIRNLRDQVCGLKDRAERAEAELAELHAILNQSAADMTAGTITAGALAVLRDELAAAQQREAIAIASWDEERNRALREGGRVVEWRDRAERAEAELATERAHRNELSTLVKRLVREARRARPSDPLSFIAVDYLVRNKLHGEPMRTAMKEGAK